MSDEKQTTEQQGAPQIEGEIVGEMTPGEIQAFQSLQTHAKNTTYQIGQAVIDILRRAESIGVAEQRFNALLQGVGKRLGLDENEQWRVVEGKVVRLPQVDHPADHPAPAPTPATEEG